MRLCNLILCLALSGTLTAQTDSLTFTGSLTPCVGSCDTFTVVPPQYLIPPLSYAWSTGNSSPTHFLCFDMPGPYPLGATVTDNAGNSVSGVLEIVVIDAVPVDISSNNSNLCNGDPDSSSTSPLCERTYPNSTVTYYFNSLPGVFLANGDDLHVIGESSFTYDPPAQSVTVTWGEAGMGSIGVMLFANGNCIGKDELCIEIVEEPKAAFITDPLPQADGIVRVCLGQPVYFQNQSTDAEQYEWWFDPLAPSVAALNFEHTYETPGLYTVAMIARSGCLCTDTTFIQVEVLPAVTLLPDCAGTVCAGEAVTYTAGGSCGAYVWEVSANGTVLGGGGTSDNSITIQWNSGPFGRLTLQGIGCAGNACPTEGALHIPIVDDNAEIAGRGRVCPGSEEEYRIEAFNGVGYNWMVSPGGAILGGNYTDRITVKWNDNIDPAQEQWVAVEYDNCYLGCGGQDTLPVLLRPGFGVSGPGAVCAGGNIQGQAYLLPNSPALTCQWTITGPDNAVFWTSVTASSSVSVPAAMATGDYQILARPVDLTQTCADSAVWTTRLAPRPPKPTGIAGPVLICPGQTDIYEASGIGPDHNILWEVKNGPGGSSWSQTNPLVFSFGNSTPRWIAVQQSVFSDGLYCASDTLRLDIGALGTGSIDGPLTACEGASSLYQATNPGDDGEFSWAVVPASAGVIVRGKNNRDVEIAWLEPGTHTLSVIQCSQTTLLAITVHPRPQPVFQHPAGVCTGTNATVQLISPLPSTVSWQDTAGSELAASNPALLEAGSYIAVVTDHFGCTNSGNFTIESYPLPNLTISTLDPTGFCNNSRNVTIKALTTEDGDFTYQWYQDGQLLAANTAIFSTNQYGFYTAQVTNQYGCTATDGPIEVFEYCQGNGACYNPNQPLPCPNANVDMSISPTPLCAAYQFQLIPGSDYVPGTAHWKFGEAGASVLGQAYADNTVFTFPNAGQYIVALYLQLQNGNQCLFIDSVRVEAFAQFDAEIHCPGDSTLFKDVSTFLPDGGIASWQWDFGDPASGTGNQSTQRDTRHLYNQAGAVPVSLTVTALTGCTATATTMIEVPILPGILPVPPSATCQDNATGFNLQNALALTDINWTFGDPSSGSLDQGAGLPAYHSYQTAGSFAVGVTGRNAYGCTAGNSLAVDISAGTLSGTITYNTPICEGQTTVLQAPAGAVGYQWSAGNASGPALTVGEAGAYTVTLTDAAGCTFAPPPAIINVNPAPVAGVSGLLYNDQGLVTGATDSLLEVCAGEPVHLVIQSLSSYYQYAWSGNNGNGSELIFNDVHNNILPQGDHLYTVTVTNPATGCTMVTDPFLVQVHPVPSGFSVVQPAGPACAGGPNTLTYNGPQPAEWIIHWNTGEIGPVLVTEEPGRYFVRVTNQFGCASESNEAHVQPGPYVEALPSGCHRRCRPDTLCLPDYLDASAWQWYLDGQPLAGATGPDLIAVQSGTYQAVLTDFSGCTAQSDPLTLDLFDGTGDITGRVWADADHDGVLSPADTLLPDIELELLHDGLLVGNGQTNGSGAFTWLAQPVGAYTMQVGVLPSNWHVITGENSLSLEGCGAISQVDFLLQFSTCSTFFDTLTLFVCPGETVSYQGIPLEAGALQNFILSSPEGCDTVVQVGVQSFEAVNFDFSTESSCSNQATGKLTVLGPTGGLAPYSYSLNGIDFQAANLFPELEAGGYVLYLRDSRGCVFEEPISVEARPALEVVLPDGLLSCDNESVLLKPLLAGDTTGLSFHWENGATAPTMLATTPGPVRLRVSNSCQTVQREAMVHWADFDTTTSLVYFPNVFAPEAVGPENRVFRPYFPSELQVLDFHLTVYDRWGNLLYETEQPDDEWQGHFRRQMMAPGVYAWFFTARLAVCGRELEIFRKGDVAITR